MRAAFPTVIVSGILLAAAGSLVREARAQESQITPAPLPSIGVVPAAPDGAQVTFDKNAVELLTYLVEMCRLLGGGMSQLVASAQTAEHLLIENREVGKALLSSISGPKRFPVNNGKADVAAREGGPSLREMVDDALNGRGVGPGGIQAALTEFRARYRLDQAFALHNDQHLSKVIIANGSARGAVAASTAEESYKRANASMGRITGYITALENSNDLKSSVDINTRVMIEIAQQINETLRTQAAIASLAGSYFMALGAESAEPAAIRDLLDFNR
ncbi:MAG: hypothetical protein EOR30_31720 [Mesorhizobium sp.]|uniref:Type IV secretion system protein VirB5 n=1 Tax=Mesorhizobium mediterraneum TaxID=43617 RepID=A0AB36QZX9_9HYPH|nr:MULTISPECIES: type IV secretion system protein [Mesorhizobium]PAP97974.1 hypothetical protein CIT25_33170 [Mesorhizobium mediterraneum]RUU79595.1 hypothetical protein EOC06_15465 [Mesorhizobium sp. M7A.F.Ca.MR.362.00.0.0]RWA97264.1 MAG: hypothetical protein EOQ37_35010 [Mesorhizobium sp.]RWB09521.1 MAG: hypothetical protein EOQ39_33560 [Mesorhizobium sp.]RWI32378.1 MAG: hypothetical protein EOR14_34960 [Mesorhizobium sp.]